MSIRRGARGIAAGGLLLLLLAGGCIAEAGEWARPAQSDVPALRPYVPPPPPSDFRWPPAALRLFSHALVDQVFADHVVDDPEAKTFGMTYEFFRDGKKIQVFGLDTMHDGAWFMSSMITAHRADPEGGYLELAQRYQIPFYTNLLLNSDRLFPAMRPTGEDLKGPFPEPIKGWAPRGWDEGMGVNFSTGRRFEEGYHTSSNHLMQDLADALMNVWMTTADPDVAAAVNRIAEYKREHFRAIRVIETAAGVVSGNREWAKEIFRARPPRPGLTGRTYSGLFLQRGGWRKYGLAAYSDPLAWSYRGHTGAVLFGEPLDRGYGLGALGHAYGMIQGMEVYFDDAPWPYGLFFFDLQEPPAFVPGRGRLDLYHSTAEKHFGGRGIQVSWVAAALLPLLAREPELWESVHREHHADEPLVRIVDTPPVTDGVRDPVYLADGHAFGVPGATAYVVSDPKNLHLFVESSAPPAVEGERKKPPELRIALRHEGDVEGTALAGEIILHQWQEGRYVVKNGLGAELLSRGAYRRVANRGWRIEVAVPYTHVPGQGQWINAVENGRYALAIDGAPAGVLYMLSRPARIRRRLENLALGTIDTWYRIWRETGCIPSGLTGPRGDHSRWEMSDVGNVAHLVKAIALWLIYRSGRSEWEIIRQEHPDEPKPHRPLPASVLRAQGLE